MKEGDYLDKLIQKKIEENKQKLEEVEKKLSNAPIGSLKIQKKRGKDAYYHQFKNKNTGEFEKKFIGVNEKQLVSDLAEKSYLKKVKPLVEKQIQLLENIQKMQYNQNEINSVYDDLSDRRRELITPISISPKEQIRRWENENYETNNKYEENMIFETDRGEMVRSKSELIIANILNQNKNLLYKYERPLELIINGKVQVFYPDFTILNINTGKITYWEHAGLMDDPTYSSQFVNKINNYLDNDIVLGNNLVVTYETKNNPLNIKYVRKNIECILN